MTKRGFMPLAERLWRHVDKSGECWVWTGYRNSNGYGQITDSGTKKPLGAHRVAWECSNGPIPPGLFVCHRCDNPPCCRPDHLFLGTAGDNNRDAFRKGRHLLPPTAGQDNGNAKLTDEQVAEIRRLVAAGHSKRSLARRFPVSRTAITNIALGKNWRHLAVES